MTSGLHGGEMVVIAARPSMGKTSLAMNIAEYVSIEQRLPVGVFSLEMTSESLVLRMLCSRSRVNLRNVREGFLAERDFPKLYGGRREAGERPSVHRRFLGPLDSPTAGQGAPHVPAIRHQAFRS